MDIGALTSLAEEENRFTGNGRRRSDSSRGVLPCVGAPARGIRGRDMGAAAWCELLARARSLAVVAGQRADRAVRLARQHMEELRCWVMAHGQGRGAEGRRGTAARREKA